jgi:energy-coupling factor transport system substrate-specific component
MPEIIEEIAAAEVAAVPAPIEPETADQAVAAETAGASGHELRLMWRNTRMVVLCVLSAALYAAVLVPFKVVPLIPGVTEVRPGNAIPVVCSFLFGPAAAWGSALGNMIGDFFGGAGPGDIFGFVGNLAYGYIPYKVWSIIASADESPIKFTPSAAAKYAGSCLAASVLCADLVGWGDNLLSLRPFWILGNAIIFNNMLAAIALSPLILIAVYPRVRAGRLLYADVMPEVKPRPMPVRIAGLAMLITGEAGAWIAGNLISTGRWAPHFLPLSFAQTPYDKAIAVMVSPLILVALAGMLIL